MGTRRQLRATLSDWKPARAILLCRCTTLLLLVLDDYVFETKLTKKKGTHLFISHRLCQLCRHARMAAASTAASCCICRFKSASFSGGASCNSRAIVNGAAILPTRTCWRCAH